MPAKVYVLKLTHDERRELLGLTKMGKAAGWKIQRAQALLKCDQGSEGPDWIDDRAAEATDCRSESASSGSAGPSSLYRL